MTWPASLSALGQGRRIGDWTLFAVAAVYVLPLAGLLFWRPTYGILYALAPLALLLVSHGPLAIAAVIVASFFYFPLPGEIALLPADMAAFALIAAYLVDLLVRRPVDAPNPIARAYLPYLLVMLLSIALELFTPLSVRYFFRQVVLFATFLATAHFGRSGIARKILIVYVVAATVNSAIALIQFLPSGGAVRAFGLAGRGFGDHAMLALIIGAVFYLWSRDVRWRVFWGAAAWLAAGGIVATQTRASAITAGWCLLVVLILTLWKARDFNLRISYRNLAIAAVLAVIIVPILVFYTPVFSGIAHRFGRLGPQARETVLLRVTLWKAALAAFSANPLFGIGAGNFSLVSQWVPTVRFDPIFYMVSGLSTHAVIMTALAETGIAGVLSLAWFFWRALRTAWRNLTAVVSEAEMPVVISLMAIAVAVVGSVFYAGSWFWGNNSYHMAVFFGLIASFGFRPAEAPVEKVGR
ncbi:MAG: O-antigen ligase family protein [candidate division Zixibacteria bacterium]|nr:O-antigen ligase family protein [candidate division Zixibacteria bacterium]